MYFCNSFYDTKSKLLNIHFLFFLPCDILETESDGTYVNTLLIKPF